MSISLDVGIDSIKTMRREGNQLVAKRCRSLYAVIADSPSRRDALEKLEIPYSTAEEQIVIMGDAAAHYGELFQVPTLSLFPPEENQVPSDENVFSAEVMQALILSMIDQPKYPQEPCCVVLPSLNSRRQHVANILREAGYQPLIQSPGMAIVLAELVKESFNGIGLSLGAGSSTMSLSHNGVEVARYTLPLGANWIDEQLAEANEDFGWDARGNRYLKTEKVRQWKEARGNGFLNPSTEGEQILKEVYTHMLKELIQQAGESFNLIPRVHHTPQPVSLVCSGGPARLPGIRELIERTLLTTPFPIEVNRVRVAAESPYVVARGCLIHAELENQAEQSRAA